MRTYKGIVCEINKNYMIFMTADGEFLRGTPLVTNAQIGDDVEFQLFATSFLSKKRKSFIIAPALVAAVIMIFLVTALFPSTNSAYAFVQIGNELELGIDEEGTVISVKPINNEPTYALDTKLEGLPIDLALTKAITQIEKHNETVPITTKFNDDQPSKAKEKILNTVNKAKNKQSLDGPIRKKNLEDNKNNNKQNSNTHNSNNGQKQNNSNSSSNKQNHQLKNEEQLKQNKSSNYNNENHNGNKDKQNPEKNNNGKNNMNENNSQNNKNSNNQNNVNPNNNQNNGNPNKNNQNKGTSE
ncbi:anti-sigma factor domain-containing protein [Ureibacillus acetophenoni]|uniref:Anti-sigma factor-like protein n=1 Tax=Ureibacillus acetophenoni TaxID=614649 RepID=A0A285U6S5_9BACL|nr:anti-sigma factor domain-containing protein [Ureibacillus acetophenoni]SOC37387.1 anti-sigma factor-like protein [Ureibacillus acetophenoni]